jgi:hypothetical protein
LFQLGVLGQLLLELKRLPGVTVTSLRPIADGSGGPVYAVVDQSGRTWDLWFEAASCWERYSARDSYQILASGLTQIDGRPFAPAHLRPDLLLARPGGEVLSLECKFPHIGLDPGYVASGFPQAHAYAGQLARSFRRVHSYVIGPQELVPTRSSLRIRGVRVGFAGPQHLDEILDSLFN